MTIASGANLRPSLAGATCSDPFDLEPLLVEALARELGRRFGGNAVLNRLEAASLVSRFGRERRASEPCVDIRAASKSTTPDGDLS
jgi:hypothetical protein